MSHEPWSRVCRFLTRTDAKRVVMNTVADKKSQVVWPEQKNQKSRQNTEQVETKTRYLEGMKNANRQGYRRTHIKTHLQRQARTKIKTKRAIVKRSMCGCDSYGKHPACKHDAINGSVFCKIYNSHKLL